MIVPQAVAPNFATLIVTRVIAGALGGVLQNAMETFVADIWLTDQERNLPVTLYTFVLVGGVTLGPVFGAIFHELSWRWYADHSLWTKDMYS
jgi:MFS family permease